MATRVIHESGVVRVRECRHGVMAFPTTDEHVGRSLDLYGQWAEAELMVLAPLLPRGGVAIDVGANVGTHTLAFAKAVGPTGAVIAFEPQRFMHQLTCTNLTLNGVTCARVVHGAVGAEFGAVTVPDIDYSVPGQFGGLSLGQWKSGDQVSVFALDGLGLSRLDVLKVDVEGMEGQVFDGARALIAKTKPAIYFEHNAPQGAPDVIERLLKHEYRCFWHFSPFFDPNNFAGLKDDVFGGVVDANVLALPRAKAEGLEQVLDPLTGPEDTAVAALKRR